MACCACIFAGMSEDSRVSQSIAAAPTALPAKFSLESNLPVTWYVGGMQVLVAGSEATLDYRVQLYTPAYLQSTNPRPVMSGAPTDVIYGQAFTVNFSVTTSIDRVVMVRQSAVTHSIHMDLRMVALDITSTTAGVVQLTAPPDATIAPPGYYMLFIMYLGVPAAASWVHVG